MSGRNNSWNYNERNKLRGNGKYVIRSGDEVIAEVRSRGDADLICRNRNHAARQAMEIAFQARQHRLQVGNLRDDIRVLLGAIEMASDALRQTTRERDVTAAREKLRRVIKHMKARGHNP